MGGALCVCGMRAHRAPVQSVCAASEKAGASTAWAGRGRGRGEPQHDFLSQCGRPLCLAARCYEVVGARPPPLSPLGPVPQAARPHLAVPGAAGAAGTCHASDALPRHYFSTRRYARWSSFRRVCTIPCAGVCFCVDMRAHVRARVRACVEERTARHVYTHLARCVHAHTYANGRPCATHIPPPACSAGNAVQAATAPCTTQHNNTEHRQGRVFN